MPENTADTPQKQQRILTQNGEGMADILDF